MFSHIYIWIKIHIFFSLLFWKSTPFRFSLNYDIRWTSNPIDREFTSTIWFILFSKNTKAFHFIGLDPDYNIVQKLQCVDGQNLWTAHLFDDFDYFHQNFKEKHSFYIANKCSHSLLLAPFTDQNFRRIVELQMLHLNVSFSSF